MVFHRAKIKAAGLPVVMQRNVVECVVMVYVHVCMCERDTVGRGYQYVGHTMQATETG